MIGRQKYVRLGKAARQFGIDRKTLRRWLEKNSTWSLPGSAVRRFTFGERTNLKPFMQSGQAKGSSRRGRIGGIRPPVGVLR